MIILVQHDSAWPRAFEHEAAQLRHVLGDQLLELHHIGSTAVPALVAKPVIDMLAVVASVEVLDLRSAAFEAFGYQVMGEFGIAGRRYFRKDDRDGRRTHQIHAFAAGSSEIRRHLDFQDYLRAHPATAEAYAALKQRLAGECGSDIQRYTEGKTPFIREVERRAAVWKRWSNEEH